MALLYSAFTQIPLVEVAVVANAMGRRLPKGATPSSNLAGGGESAGPVAGMETGRFWAKEWRQRKAPKKGIEMQQQLR